MGLESRKEQKAQQQFAKAVTNGQFDYNELVAMLVDRSRFMNVYELEQALKVVNLELLDLER